MKSERLLGGFENLLLLVILRLDDRAYGVAIRRELLEQAEKDVAIGAIYTGLDRLEKKGFVKSWSGEPTPERGGRAKKFYRVTAQGKKALEETHRAVRRLSIGLEAMNQTRIACLTRILGTCALLLAAACAMPGQAPPPAEKWVGAWTLNTHQSTFGTSGLTIVSQMLKIEQTTREIRLSGDTVYSDRNGSHSSHDNNSLNLDGRATVVGPISHSFMRIDYSTFDIISKLNAKNPNIGEVSHFSFSLDGKTLTETKTQTEREAVPEGADKATGAVLRTFISILVFSRTP
jgi:PadR family transcriptional regulator PadR